MDELLNYQIVISPHIVIFFYGKSCKHSTPDNKRAADNHSLLRLQCIQPLDSSLTTAQYLYAEAIYLLIKNV